MEISSIHTSTFISHRYSTNLLENIDVDTYHYGLEEKLLLNAQQEQEWQYVTIHKLIQLSPVSELFQISYCICRAKEFFMKIFI